MAIIYGLHAVQSVIRHQSETVKVLFYDKKRNDQRLMQVLEMAKKQGIHCTPTNKAQLDDKADGERHQGILIEAVDKQQNQSLNELIENLSEPAFLLVLDGVTDPHNLGACLRTAEAAGVHAVIYPKDKSAGINSTVRKVACGAAEVIPTYAVTNLARTLQEIQQLGVWVIGTAGEAEQSLYEMDLSGPMALVMGAEGDGMRRLTREHCDYLAKLPMAGTVSSLNVSVATGVCLFEMVRQRAKK